MKIKTTTRKQNPTVQGFTLIEMIGVLAVIAILAALLIPKVFNAINDAKVNTAVVGAQTVKTALVDHYGKYDKFDTIFGTNTITIPATGYPGYDTNVLTVEGLLDKPFLPKIGTNATVQVRPCVTLGNAVDGTAAAYSLAGNGTNDVVGQYVLEAVIYGVPETDAQAVSSRLDGPTLSQVAMGQNDYNGRVKYTAPSAGGAATVFIYLTHR